MWMNENIKSKIKAKNKLYQEYVKKGRQETDFCALEESVRNLNDLILQTKTSYYENLGRKLNDPTLQSKTYWSILKGFYNGKRVPVIPPLLVNNKFVTDFKAKANIFNDFFSKQCTPLANGSKLPENQVYLTNSRINSVPFSDDLVINIIRNLNVNKAHGHDDISIRMIKMCDESLLRPLSIIFRNSLKSSIYPTTWKKANIIPVHKKDDKQCVNNYRPVSLLPVFGKIFEKLIFNEIYSFLDREKLLNTNQSGFRPFDSCVNQLLTITHEMFSSFDCNPSLEVRSIFLDISKAFDKV